MLSSLVDELRYGTVFPELKGARVLVSGVSSRMGVDISRAFADHRARLLLQMNETSVEMDEVASMLAQTADELRVYDGHASTSDAASLFAQGPAQRAFGGLDVVINLIELTRADLNSAGGLKDVEDLVSEKLLAPTLMSRIVANRMRLTWTNGIIINVINAPSAQNAREAAVGSLVGATLAAMTRKEAEQWGAEGVRINAINPGVSSGAIAGSQGKSRNRAAEPDVAALALYLASEQGAGLSGQVFDPALVAR